MKLPAPLILGNGTVTGSLEGSLVAPDLKTAWHLPEANASGRLEVSRVTTKVTCKAPALDVSAALHVVAPDLEAVKKAVTQAEVSALAAPVWPLPSPLPPSYPPPSFKDCSFPTTMQPIFIHLDDSCM